MFTSAQNWLNANPLWHDALVLVATIVLAPFITRTLLTFKKFVSIPPQRLNIWILKARISSADSELQDFYRLRQDQSYLIARCFISLILTTLAATVLVSALLLDVSRAVVRLGLHGPGNFMLGRPGLFVVSGFQLVGCCCLVYIWMSALTIRQAIIGGDTREQMLKVHLERLKTKLPG
jgi:hypothetical protein